MELDIPESIRSLLLLTNPGSRRAKEIHRELESRVAEIAGSCQVIWRDIFSPPDQQLAVDRAVIVGGDGTVNLGLKWLQEAGVAAPVALIPAGTGNNLARGLGLPVKASDAIRIAFCTVDTRRIDAVGMTYDGATRGLMLQVAAAGMPAHIARRFDQLRHMPVISYPVRWIGDPFYRLLALRTIASNENRSFEWDIDIDGESMELSGSALFFCNEGTIGGGFTPCPKANIDDGLLDVCLLPTLGFRETLQLFRQVSAGTHLDSRDDIFYRQCKRVRLKQSRYPFLVDGDIMGTPEVIELQSFPASIELVIPEIS
jgi:diacylglycerol kinase (ATP)